VCRHLPHPHGAADGQLSNRYLLNLAVRYHFALRRGGCLQASRAV
jgi:hypothetical protein